MLPEDKYQLMMDTLNAFESPDEIADFLRMNGVKGEVQDGEACVITNWFLTETDALACSTTERMVTVMDENYNDWVYDTSDTVNQFIVAFDDWAYPELIVDDPSDFDY